MSDKEDLRMAEEHDDMDIISLFNPRWSQPDISKQPQNELEKLTGFANEGMKKANIFTDH